MAETWSASLGEEPMDVSVIVNPDGTGRILAHSVLGAEARRELTTHFTACIRGLWATLDSLVSESVEMFSVLNRPRDTDRPRFFPIADSNESYQSLLARSCIDGVTADQARIISASQPFRELPDGHPAGPYQEALRRLINWGNAIDNGDQVGAWATPANPQILVRPPMAPASVTMAEPGELTANFTVADFAISGYVDGANVEGFPGTYVDLGFVTEFHPDDLDDTFDARLSRVFDAVTGFMLMFTAMAEAVPGAKKILAPPKYATREHWQKAFGSARDWTSGDLDALSASGPGMGVVTDADELTFVLATAAGVFERVVPDATPLRSLDRSGIAAEMAVQDAASTWGLPDFVFSPVVEQKGSGVREIGDGILVVGRRGAIVQVKTREVAVGTPEREESWVKKQIAIAGRQVKGTARRMTAGPTEMQNARGRAITVDGPNIEWVGVVIVEHPSPPTIDIDPVEIGLPYLVLLRRDWEFLFSQLRSTYAVVDYLHRVAMPTEILGEEPHRYFELAKADSEAEPRSTDPRAGESTVLHSVPLLPTAPVGDEDLEAHEILRRLLEEIANSEIGDGDETIRQRVLASIDSLPVGYRTDLGEYLLNALAELRSKAPGTAFWAARTFLSEEGHDQLGFAVASGFNESTRAVFNQWLVEKHDKRRESENIDNATSIGVLITPRSDGFRDWDTSMAAVHGGVELSDEERGLFEKMWTRR
ncbi:hypothetical protein [Agreia pratensis]|uniref:Uncharacterized protein n=1 Tax=Agreia pratensis TaxID=150121 RepID=A0A1X7KSB4_9MICO|nr:hypothetical protein [Agreia pratensis]SMG44495.1 hypothetical protein SAMN06296010_2887 [Agreia pratensis]